jgi:transposase-like protein
VPKGVPQFGREHRFSDAEVAEMVRLYVHEKWTLAEVADRFDCGHTSVRHILKKCDVPVRTQREAQALMWERRRRAAQQALLPPQPEFPRDTA